MKQLRDIRLQFITQDLPGIPPWVLAEEACKAGVKWVQLRVKHRSFEEYLNIAFKTKMVTDQYKATLIINDSLEVALAAKADGVHLGLNDRPIAEARERSPAGFIIGGTANTFEDITRQKEGADYIGLGPYRFTSTKKNLSPILGINGYKIILEQCFNKQWRVPIVAIGGILPEDVPNLMATGISGIAVSSAISRAEDKKRVVNEFENLLRFQKV